MPFEEDPRTAWIEDMLAVLARLGTALEEAYRFSRSSSPHRWIEDELHEAMVEAANLKSILTGERWRGTEYSARKVAGRMEE